MKEIDGWVKIKSEENTGLAHELWAAAQLLYGEGITDGVDRIVAILGENIWHCESKSEWQEIATIPETYGLYLVMCNSSNGYELMRFTDRGWEYYQYAPTHWNPLPSPPQENKSWAKEKKRLANLRK